MADPQPMDLDRTRFPRIEQRCSGLCFNCNQPGHIAHDCPRPRPHQVRATLQEESSQVPPQLAPEDLRVIIDSLKGHCTMETPPARLEEVEDGPVEDFLEGNQ